LTCHLAPGTVPHGWCPDCGHLILAHRMDGECAACNVFLQVTPGMRLLVTPDAYYSEMGEVEVLLDGLKRQFPEVEFVILTGATVQVLVEDASVAGDESSVAGDRSESEEQREGRAADLGPL